MVDERTKSKEHCPEQDERGRSVRIETVDQGLEDHERMGSPVELKVLVRSEERRNSRDE